MQEFLARLSELVALYKDAPTFCTLGRQRSTEAYRGIRAEEDVGGRGLQSVFTSAGQQGLRRSVSAPVPAAEGGGGAVAAAIPPPPPRLMRTLTTGVRHKPNPPQGVWQWENDPVGSGRFVTYDAAAQDLIRAAREAGMDRLELQAGGNSRYMLHFDAGVQVNCATQFIRQIRTV